MLNASRGCRVRTTVVIDGISGRSAFSEGVYRDGGGALSSASRVVFAGRRCGHAGQRPKAVVPLATAPSALQDASNRRIDSRNVVCFNAAHQMPGFLRAYNRCWALATQAFVLLQGQWRWGSINMPRERACPHLEVSVSSPKGRLFTAGTTKATSASPKRVPRDPPNSNGLQVGTLHHRRPLPLPWEKATIV